MAIFAHYEVREIVRSVAEGPIKEVGPPTWKSLDCASVGVLGGWPLT